MAINDDANELKDILSQLKDIIGGVNANSEQFTQNLGDQSDQANNLKQTIENINEDISRRLQYEEDLGKVNASYLQSAKSNLRVQIENTKSKAASLQKEMQGNKELARKIKVEKQGLINAQKKRKLSDVEAQKLEELKTAHTGITKVIQNQKHEFDGLVESIEEGEEKAQDLGKAINQKKATEKLGSALDGVRTPLDGMLNPLNLINQLFSFIFGTALELDAEIGGMAKSMNMTYDAAAASREEMVRFAEASGDLNLNATKLQENVVALNQEMGTNVAFEKMGKDLQNDVALMSKLQNTAGLTADETNAIMKFSAATGKTGKETLKQFSASFKMQKMRRGLVLNEKDAMKEIGKLSASIKLSIAGGAEGLGKAMVAAKALGTDLGKVDDIAGSLLNFEESIANELEAELLTGKELNLEKARQAALNGELATVADEIAENIGSAAEFTAMNRIQQEAIAKAVGMTREDLASSLMEQEALSRMSEVEGETMKEKYETLRKTMTAEEASKVLGDEALATQLEQASVQEKGALAMQKMKDFASKELIPALREIGKNFEYYFNKIRDIIEKLGGMKAILVVIGGIMAAKLVKGTIDFAKSVGDGISMIKKLKFAQLKEAAVSVYNAAFKTFGGIPIVGLGLAAAAGAAAYAGIQALAGNDVFSPGGSGGGYGNRTLFGPEGAIALNNKDDIIAGTDLFKKGNDVTSEGGGATKTGAAGTVSVGSDMSTVVAAINDLGAKVEAMANRPINVGMDGQKVIEAGTGNNPNTFGEEVGKNSFDLQ